MKIGDLVRYNSAQKWAAGLNLFGLVIETGIHLGHNNVKILWNSGSIEKNRKWRLVVIHESG